MQRNVLPICRAFYERPRFIIIKRAAVNIPYQQRAEILHQHIKFRASRVCGDTAELSRKSESNIFACHTRAVNAVDPHSTGFPIQKSEFIRADHTHILPITCPQLNSFGRQFTINMFKRIQIVEKSLVIVIRDEYPSICCHHRTRPYGRCP